MKKSPIALLLIAFFALMSLEVFALDLTSFNYLADSTKKYSLDYPKFKDLPLKAEREMAFSTEVDQMEALSVEWFHRLIDLKCVSSYAHR